MSLEDAAFPEQEGQHVEIPTVKLVVQTAGKHDSNEIACKNSCHYEIRANGGRTS